MVDRARPAGKADSSHEADPSEQSAHIGPPHPGRPPAATPLALAYKHACLAAEELAHLQLLMGSWGMLADLSFSDLLLLVPVKGSRGSEDGSGMEGRGGDEDEALLQRGSTSASNDISARDRFVVLGQMRPSTSQTLYPQDLVGEMFDAAAWVLAVEAWRYGRIVTGDIGLDDDGELAGRAQCIPVSFRGSPIAVLVRASWTSAGRRPGELERVYMDLFDRVASMVAEGSFPFPGEDLAGEEAPRVGDGIISVDAAGRVVFASPNAVSALHRMGIYDNVKGCHLADLGIEETAVERSMVTCRPVIEEIERRPDVTVLLHSIPLLAQGELTGILLALRDVTDLRHRDRLLLSKDAAIREVHHRVKNNLQTISALLRLQARRTKSQDAVSALNEAERRVRSIAVVHEILAREPADQVPFGEIVDSLVRMAAETAMSSTMSVEIAVEGAAVELSADVATPLALVIAELLQNAVEHAFVAVGPRSTDPSGRTSQEPGSVGHVMLFVSQEGSELAVRVEDDGVGLPAGFEIGMTSSLGLSIVRDLVTSQLGGSIALESGGNHRGTVAWLRLPLPVA